MNKLSLVVQYASTESNLPARQQFRRWTGKALQQQAKVTLRVVDEQEGRELNRTFRNKDYATNVLTFVSEEEGLLYGDVVLCAPVVAQEAHQQGKDWLAHYAHLTVHAILHLQGYVHEEEKDAQEMETLETAIMIQLGYADPYQEIFP